MLKKLCCCVLGILILPVLASNAYAARKDECPAYRAKIRQLYLVNLSGEKHILGLETSLGAYRSTKEDKYRPLMCKMQLKSLLKKADKAVSRKKFNLTADCQAFATKLDQQCFKPFADKGEDFSKGCQSVISSYIDTFDFSDIEKNLQNQAQCKGALAEF